MKKTILISLLTTLLCSATYGATLQRTILSHKGQLTTYDRNHWQEAINDAVAGDTIYFSPGAFGGNFTITKPITLIGAGMSEADVFWKDTNVAAAYEGCATTGESTYLDAVTIAIPGSPTLTATLIEGVRLTGVSITEPVKNLKIKRCHIMYYSGGDGDWRGNFGASAQVTNLQLENCAVGTINLDNFVNPNIHNCYLHNIYYSPEEIEFVNCNIVSMSSIYNCSFINCILRFWSSTGDNTCVNCINCNSWEEQTWVDSWNDDGFILTKAQLIEKGYLGNDGTVVGLLGGPAPFTLIPSQPYVSSSSVTYNKTTKKLNVNVTVKKGQ